MKKQLFSCLLLLLIASSLSAQDTTSIKPLSRTDVAIFTKAETEYRQLQKELTQLEKEKTMLFSQMQELDKKQTAVISRLQTLETKYDNMIGTAAGGQGQDQLLNATKQMQETQMSFNLQYLQLQMNMQNENRQFTMISNIMKTKHDTVKNSISNVR